MFCKFCGSQIDDDAVFCNKCGKRLEADKNAPQTKGKGLPKPENNTSTNTTFGNSKIKYGIIAAVGVILLLVISIAVIKKISNTVSSMVGKEESGSDYSDNEKSGNRWPDGMYVYDGGPKAWGLEAYDFEGDTVVYIYDGNNIRGMVQGVSL